MPGLFHLVIATKYLDTFGPEIIKANKADDAFAVAQGKFKSHDNGESLAHFKLFASPVEAKTYVDKLKIIQNQASEYKRTDSAPEQWIQTKISEIKVVAPKKEKKAKKYNQGKI